MGRRIWRSSSLQLHQPRDVRRLPLDQRRQLRFWGSESCQKFVVRHILGESLNRPSLRPAPHRSENCGPHEGRAAPSCENSAVDSSHVALAEQIADVSRQHGKETAIVHDHEHGGADEEVDGSGTTTFHTHRYNEHRDRCQSRDARREELVRVASPQIVGADSPTEPPPRACRGQCCHVARCEASGHKSGHELAEDLPAHGFGGAQKGHSAAGVAENSEPEEVELRRVHGFLVGVARLASSVGDRRHKALGGPTRLWNAHADSACRHHGGVDG
mmetsp:Transcript_99317/g.206882  ORF Transcript_99317/g.206882 Transcript_99317/m.206882 type:complete len:273 (-) Transcript_99317:1084-1902(-)